MSVAEAEAAATAAAAELAANAFEDSHCGEHDRDGGVSLLEAAPLPVVCATLAVAARLVHPKKPCVAVLTKPKDRLALR